MLLCVHKRMLVCTDKHMDVNVHVHVQAHADLHLHAQSHADVHGQEHADVHVHVQAHANLMCLYKNQILMCICVYKRMSFSWKHRTAERATHVVSLQHNADCRFHDV